MDAQNYIETLESQSQANNDEDIGVKQNPYSKKNAIEEVDKFDKQTQENLVQYKVGKIDEFNLSKPIIYEIRVDEPDGGWENYIQKKYVDMEGVVSEWEVTMSPNYKDVKNNTAKLHKTRYRLSPSVESIEKRKQMTTNGLISQPIISESELTKKIQDLAFSALKDKDKDREKIKSDTLAELKGLKEFIIPENPKGKDDLLLEMLKLIASKKETKDDGATAMIIEMQKMQQEFNKKIIEMQQQKFDDQIKSLKRETSIKEEYDQIIKDKLSNLTKKQSLIDQIDDIDKLTEFAKKMGFEKTDGNAEKEDSWKNIVSDGLKNIIPALPNIAERIAGMFINRQAQVSGFNPNIAGNAVPANNLLPNNNQVYMPPPAPVNSAQVNPNLVPNPAPSPVLQVNAGILRSLALLNALDLSFNAYREYNRNKDKKDIKPDILASLSSNTEDANFDVYNKLLDVQPTLMDNLDRIDIGEEIKKFINETKQLYPDFNEKINSILASGWLKELSAFIMKEAGFEETENKEPDIKEEEAVQIIES